MRATGFPIINNSPEFLVFGQVSARVEIVAKHGISQKAVNQWVVGAVNKLKMFVLSVGRGCEFFTPTLLRLPCSRPPECWVSEFASRSDEGESRTVFDHWNLYGCS